MSKKITLLVVLLLIAAISFADDEKKTVKPADSITIQELKDHMFFLASDELEGRYVGSAGYKIAAQYAVTQFRAAGLKPLLKDKDGKPTFLQEVILVKNKMNGYKPWTVKNSSGEKTFEFNTSFISPYAGNPKPDINLNEIIFVGYGISEPDHGWDDLDGFDLKGKTVLLLNGAPMRDKKPVLPKEVHRKYVGFMNIQNKMEKLMGKGVSSMILLPDPILNNFWGQLSRQQGDNARFTIKSTGEEGSDSYIPNIFFIKEDISSMIFAGQEYSPADIKEKGLEGYKTYQLKDININMGFDLEEADETPTWNVVALLEGTDPAMKDQYITLGAHLDHVAPDTMKRIRNGADDNASGSIGVMEVAEAMAMSPGKRPVIFILYGAEEAGLLGSSYFVKHPPVELKQIKANINLDMIGRSDYRNRETRAHYVVGSERLNSGLRKLIEKVNSDTVKWPLDFKNAENMIGNSDHKNFLDKGIPVAFFFSGVHKDLHRYSDDAEKIDYDKMQNICKLVFHVMKELTDMKEVKPENM
jgi:hypothetical protein